MNETIRVKTTPDGSDTYLKTSINQDFDFIEILSLKISQEDVYRKYCSDYGVVVGRVNINQGFGVPNAKVSIFIPLDEIDANNPEIRGFYPYEVITDKNDEGLRYNLLPSNPDESNECFTPVGSFLSKNDILNNPIIEGVYEKYYKFTTTTNHAGDFMFFGVPLGSYTVHVDADISNIGIASQRPYDLITQGTPIALFDSTTKFKGDKNLNKLVQIKTLNSGVNVQPFWGDIDNCEVGINRLDFDFNYNIIPSAIFMGSIFGDEGKHSTNKNCQPNRNVGQICEQVTTSGTINMIRKNLNNEIEDFDINGGRLIDEDGAWAFQIPMNLDYMITDENGNLAFSDDPTKGIPTRARIRFNIGMDENGGEGRLRTRAKYLVPHNPRTGNKDDIDYTFGPETKDISFRDLYWNKIYTVSNYITRYQKNEKTENRGTTGIKNVDNCVSVKNPFPYNKVDSNMNPIFFVLCILIFAVEQIVKAINIVVAGINFIVKGIRAICNIKIVGKRWFTALCVDYVKCVYIECKDSNYAPQCSGHGEDGIPNIKKDGLLECLLILLTEVLTVFELDFYNDWINGTLFSYLIKYKKRKSHHKFCDYECDTNESSNDCHSSYLVDSCIGNDEDNIKTIRADEGLVKKVEDEFYYAATTHDANHKMFATEIVSLGAVFECDWQGIPKINDALQTTSYILPPDISEYNETNTIRETCGMFSLKHDDFSNAFFFTIDCKGTDVDEKGCLNLRHITEIGVNLSESIINETTGAVEVAGNCFIGAEDIDEGIGHLFRDVFFAINHTVTPWIGINFFNDRDYTTNFNTVNKETYDYTSPAENGQDYITFRGYSAGNNTYTETKHSYYFYFGLAPGKSALDKMNTRFFNKCTLIEKNGLTIVSSTTADASNTGIGTITFKFVGGKPPYSYKVTGTGYLTSGTVSGSSEVLLTGLNDGTYVIDGLDAFNTPVSKTVVISGLKPLSTFVYVSKNSTTTSSNDGQITISSISGGFGPYSYTIKKGNGSTSAPSPITTTPYQINALAIEDVIGYTVTVIDSLGATSITTGLKVSGTPILSFTSTVVQPTCFDSFDGSITYNIVGGQPPYTISTTGPDEMTSNSMNVTEIGPGSYLGSLTDSTNGTPITVTNVLTANSPEIILTLPTNTNELAKQCDPTKHTIRLYASFSKNAPSSVLMGYFDNDSDDFVSVATVPYSNSSTPIVFTMQNIGYEKSFAIKFGECYSNVVIVTQGMVTKPNSALTCNIASLGLINGLYNFNVSGTGGIGNYTGTGIFTSSVNSYSATITDGVGCTASKSI